MRAIIIGSMGFIGRHLHDHFKELGFDVWGADVILDKSNDDHFFLIDPDTSDFSAIFRDITYEICVNCSGSSNVPASFIKPSFDYCLNTFNVFKILDSIRQLQPSCKFLNLSSAAVYGSPTILPIEETAVPNPLSPYGVHKLQAEEICREFYSFYQIGTCSLRVFSVYGPGLKKQLFWDIYKKTREDSAITFFGTGNESRDYIYIKDLVKAIELVCMSSDFKADIINIANGEEIRIKDAVSTFFNLFSSKINYKFTGECRKGDPINWQAGIKKLKSLGYKPSVNLTDGLRQYYEWIIKNDIR